MKTFKHSQLPTVLLVTDSPVTRAFFEEVIHKLDDHILLYSNTESDAFDSLGKTTVTFIIIDENTPDIDLATICLKIRQLKEHALTPILIMTAHLKKSFTRRLLKAGATDFLREPLEEHEFLHRYEMAKEIKKTEGKMSTLATKFQGTSANPPSLKQRSLLDDRPVKMVDLALSEQSALALMIIEIDQYEKIQKARGSKAADGLLIDFQDHLQTLMRGQDHLFSQKKGKFVVLLPKTSCKAALFIAENIQESLGSIPFSSNSIRFHLTTSMGLATLDQSGDPTKSASVNFDRLLRTATKRLQTAKKKGDTIIAESST